MPRRPHDAAEVIAYVGLGSNLANPRRQVERALAAMTGLPGTRVVARSSLYRTAPQGTAGRQPPYVNAVVALATRLDADDLLRALQTIERAQRRRRSAPNAPRSIDLDLLVFGALRRAGVRLRLPHPRLHERAFVLRPLLEIAPQISIPGRGPARKYLPRTRAQRVSRIASD